MPSSTLKSRNVTLAGHRTSMRLEPYMWDALEDIAMREGLTLHTLCDLVDRQRGHTGRTTAVRVFILAYFREKAVDDGRRSALEELLRRTLCCDETGEGLQEGSSPS